MNVFDLQIGDIFGGTYFQSSSPMYMSFIILGRWGNSVDYLTYRGRVVTNAFLMEIHRWSQRTDIDDFFIITSSHRVSHEGLTLTSDREPDLGVQAFDAVSGVSK